MLHRFLSSRLPSPSSCLRLSSFLSVLSVALLVALPIQAQAAGDSVADTEPAPFALDGLDLRNIGPVNMSGRVADVEAVPGDPRLLYVGSASGGIWKTVNGGVTFEPIFDDQPIQSIGDMALAPSNPEVIYVGTGEGNPRNSVSFGQGVYKTTDGGASWSFLGLKETRYVTRIAVHPQDPDIAWVGALGSIFGPNEERGVFKTVDGGKTWDKVLFVDAEHGVADLDVDPKNPNVIFAAMWRFDRKPWTHTSGSEDGGVFKSVDGGKTWNKLTKGLPKLLGRIGVKVAPSDPNIVYVITESDEGTLFRSDDRGETFVKVFDEPQIVSRGLYYTDLRVDPQNPDRVYAISSRLFRSIDGGKSFERISQKTHVDYHSLWIDPQDPKRIWQGQDGGIALSLDGGDTWDAPRNLPLAQFYQVFYDRRKPFYAVGGGLQDNGTWIGPSRNRERAGILPDDWRLTTFGDAYFVVPHPRRIGLYLSEYQGGGIIQYDETTRRQIEVNPQSRRGDGGPVGELEYRFNWNAPIVASAHDEDTVYFAGNVVWKTLDFGLSWERISPDLTTNDPAKQGEAGGPVWIENTTAEYHCTIISFSESPVDGNHLWVGTDDGKLQVSRDGGGSWVDLTDRLPLPDHSPISHVETSRIDAAIAYLSADRHMFDDFKPHIFKTMDGGETWKRLDKGLPEEGWVWVVREDPRNPDVVYAGTEVGLYVSFDAGDNWQILDFGDLPAVSVHDVLIQPDANDLIVGTHGRAIWMLDDLTPVQDWKLAEKAGESQAAYLFDARPALRFAKGMSRYGVGDRVWIAPNPPDGALISYYLPESLEPEQAEETESEAAEEESSPSEDGFEVAEEGEAAEEAGDEEAPLKIEIVDPSGEVIRELKNLPLGAGVHRVAWDLAEEGPVQRREAEASEFRQPPRGARVVPGTYGIRLTVGELILQTSVDVEADPELTIEPGALEAQHAAASQLVDLQSRAQTLLKTMDALSAELDAADAAWKRSDDERPEDAVQAAKSLRESLEAQMDRLTRPDGKPFWSEGPRLSENLASLFNNIDSAFVTPTAAQSAFLAELAEEVEAAEAAWTEISDSDVEKALQRPRVKLDLDSGGD